MCFYVEADQEHTKCTQTPKYRVLRCVKRPTAYGKKCDREKDKDGLCDQAMPMDMTGLNVSLVIQADEDYPCKDCVGGGLL